MKIDVATSGATEADLESRIDGVLRGTLPWLAPGEIKHQLSFSFRIGHKSMTIDGGSASKRSGRLDILLERAGKNLAVLELKRPGLALSKDDADQGLSYARLLDERAPIVIVSNGTETRVYATHTGDLLDTSLSEESRFVELMTAAAKLAEASIRNAIATLMGPGSDIWTTAVRVATDATLEDMTGNWQDRHPVFTQGLSFPRTATDKVIDALQGPRRVVAVEGGPLVGKSNVLREVAIRTRSNYDMAVLFVEASGSMASGIAEGIAHLLGSAVGWRITTDEARHWLESLGKSAGPMLVIAVDGLGLEHEVIRRELETLSARAVGDRLKFLVEADSSVIERLWSGNSRRKETVFSRRGERIEVSPLADDEFEAACAVLHDLDVSFMRGAAYAEEYRQPWMLRAMAAGVIGAPEMERGMRAVMPPLLSLDLMRYTREQFLQDAFNEQAATFARAVLDDYGRDDRDVEVMLRSMHSFLIRKASFRDHGSSGDLVDMASSGLVGTVLDERNRPLLVARVPELVASELARLVAHELDDRMCDKDQDRKAADWLVRTCARLPLGDVIGAQALVDLLLLRDGLSKDFINRLLERAPKIREMRPGTRSVAWMPDVGRVDIKTGENGATIMRLPNGVRLEVPLDQKMQTYADFEAWLILSHVAGMPMAAIDEDGRLAGRIDPAILSLVGTSPVPLRRVSDELERSGLHMHDAPDGTSIVCDKAGIVEPITFSLMRFLEGAGEEADDWLEEMCEEGSAALLARLALALKVIGGRADDTAKWAAERRERLVVPALNQAMSASYDGSNEQASPAQLSVE